jgi:uncharacterized protein YbjQ (UPF0145 family)
MDSSIPIDPKLVVTTDTLPGYEIVRSLGTAEGIGILIATGFTIQGQKERLFDVMRDAYLDMMTRAREQGAQAIVGTRYVFHANHVMVYGTAVTIQRI